MKANIYGFPGTDDECSMIKATIKSTGGSSIVLDTRDGIVTAERAFSCIVEPETGDQVLVNKSGNQYHVLSILSRPTGSKNTCLSFEGDMTIRVPHGDAGIISNNNIDLIASKTLRTAAGNTQFLSKKMTIATKALMAKADDVEAHSTQIKLFSKSIDTIASRISQRTDVLMRWVENVETLNIGNMIQNIRNTKICHAKQTIMTAKQDMRIDAERIHMG